jgi:hypothetical protein
MCIAAAWRIGAAGGFNVTRNGADKANQTATKGNGTLWMSA